jgi:hypothetical protein
MEILQTPHSEPLAELAAPGASHRLDSRPVRVERLIRYARIDMDVWPKRLNEEGMRRLEAACCEVLRRQKKQRSFSYGRSGTYVRVSLENADELAAALRAIAADPDYIEEVGSP